jgi:hypothetical protein
VSFWYAGCSKEIDLLVLVKYGENKHKNYRPVSFSRKTLIVHSVKLKYNTLRSSKARLNSKFTYPDISIRLCGNHRIPVFHTIWMEKGRLISWPPHSPKTIILISFWELSCIVRRASLKTVKGGTVWAHLTWRTFCWRPRVITHWFPIGINTK